MSSETQTLQVGLLTTYSHAPMQYKQADTSPDQLYSITDGELKQDADHNTIPALQAETSFSSFCNYK